MQHWTAFPHHHHHEEGFTTLSLPPDDIRDDLAQLPSPTSAPLTSPLLLKLKAAIAPWRAQPLDHILELGELGVRVRKDQKSFSPEEQEAFKNAVTRSVADGRYAQLVLVHADMQHNMHGSMGPTGMLRFLPWHRRYLLEFERMLVAAHTALGGVQPLVLPYWHWPDPFPAWLAGFLPQPHPVTGNAAPARTMSAPPPKPTLADEDYVLTGYANQLPNTAANGYLRFTYGLEGWGRRADGTRLPAHNSGHDWVGGIMRNTRYSPTDPIFWLHHAEVDRLWSVWQQSQPTERPQMEGADLVMSPWTETYDDVAAVESLGYIYAAPV